MPRTEVVARMNDALAAYNAQDWARFRSCFADDLVVSDHRPPPAVYDGIAGADAFVDAVRALFELASGISVATVATHVVDERRAVFELNTTGLTADASDFELAFILAYVIDAGTIAQLAFFPDDQLEAARSSDLTR
jgi:ketosteroid isomerase-like protein